MLQLLINTRPAYLPTNLSIRLTRVNPYFEDQGDYTLEVTLPLQGCPQNLSIFGPIHHPSQAHQPYLRRHYPMQLICPPIHLHGYALITSITPTAVRLQLVAGRSALAHAIEDTTTYIDQLDLGRCWDTFSSYDFITYDEENHQEDHLTSGDTLEDQRAIFCLPDHIAPRPALGPEGTDPNHHIPTIMMHGTYPQTDTVCLPCYSLTNDTLTNHHDATTSAISPLRPSSPLYHNRNFQSPLSAQPYLLSVLRHLLRAAGYPDADLTALESTWTRQLIIVSARCDIERAHHLPHWTLSTFIRNLQEFLSVVFLVTDDGRVTVRTRSDYYHTSTPIRPTLISTLEAQTDIDTSDDAQTQTALSGNVDYSYPKTNDILRLPDEVFTKALYEDLPTHADILRHYNSLTPSQRSRSTYLYHDRSRDTYYAILAHHNETDPFDRYHLTRVNQFSPLLRSTIDREINYNLPIVPARQSLYFPSYDPDTSLAPTTPTDPASTKALPYAIPYLLSNTPTTATANSYNINNAINPDDDDDTQTQTDTTQTDTLELAYYSPQSLYNSLHLCPISIPYATHPLTRLPYPLNPSNNPSTTPDGPFTLSTTTNPLTIGGRIAAAPLIDTRVEHHIPFHLPPTLVPDPTRPYLISGRLYACHKLELTLTPTGPSPLIQGYFYEIQ